ncbi:MAG: hypothetical protein V3S64_02340 [bacterium]
MGAKGKRSGTKHGTVTKPGVITKQPAGKEAKKLIVTGIRKSGESDFHFKIDGNPASQFPPLILKMTLHEMQQMLREQQAVPPQPAKDGRAALSLVS